MKLFLILTTLVLVSPVIAQEEYTGSDGYVEPPEPDINSVECGDGVCQPEIQGTCPQDCLEGYNETDNSSEESENDGGSAGLETVEIVAGALTLISGVLLVTILTKNRTSKEKTGDNIRNKNLERNMRKLLRQNISLKEVEKRMMSNGYQKDELEEAKNHIDSDLLYRNN
ncbi:MAG: hypothetical protein R6V35_02560 [Candidatus Nanohaloarchaea archaeon]